MKRLPDKYQVVLVVFVLVVATLAVYWQVRGHDFIAFDDDLYVTANENVQTGLTWQTVKWAFTTNQAYNWHPLVWLSHMLDCQFYKLNPAGHHFTNVLFHIANTLLLLLVLNRMTGRLWPSAFVAALFALHPLHIESVAWVSERKDVLSTFFWILTMWFYVRYVQRPRFTTYLPIMFSLALGLMAKQMLVTLPFALLLLDYWPLERFALFSPKSTDHKGRFGETPLSRCFLEKLPLLALSAVASAIVFLVQSEATLVKSIPLKYRIGNALVAYAEYIRKMLLPYDLGILYPHPETNLLLWKVFAAALLLACISILIILSFRSRRWLAVGWLWYLGTLVPVIGLIQVGLQAMADRYTYVPLIGLFIIISWAAADLLAKYRHRNIVLAAGAAAVLLPLAAVTYRQLSYWSDSITLYKHTVAVTANNDILHYNLGVLLVKEERFDEAVTHWTEAVRIRPDQRTIQKALEKLLARLDTAKKLFNRGNVLAEQGEFDEAISCYTKSLQLRPGHAPVHNNLANALFLKGRLEQALAHYSKAVQYNPNLVDAHYNMATLFIRQKRTDDAISRYRRVLEIDPNHPGARQALDRLLDNTPDK
jgi:tetratricopeptide (TPR) repeat protein